MQIKFVLLSVDGQTLLNKQVGLMVYEIPHNCKYA